MLSIMSRTVSRPYPVRDEVRMMEGRDSQYLSRVFLNALMLPLMVRWFSLSVLVKTMVRGMAFEPRKLANSMSMFCGGIRESIRRNTFARDLRWSI